MKRQAASYHKLIFTPCSIVSGSSNGVLSDSDPTEIGGLLEGRGRKYEVLDHVVTPKQRYYLRQTIFSKVLPRTHTQWPCSPSSSFSSFPSSNAGIFTISDYLSNTIYKETTESSPCVLALSPSSRIESKSWKIARSIRRRLWKLVQMLKDLCSVAIRATEIGVILSPLTILGPAAFVTSSMEQFTWSYLLHAIQWLGPAFVKLAQWAATRRDLFSPQVCEQLGTLQNSSIVHSWAHTDQMLVDAFGKTYAERLKIHPEDIVGSGCVAQVYKGELLLIQPNENPNGAGIPVAIKVLHPRISQMIEQDLIFIKRIACLLDALPSGTIRAMSLPRVVENFEEIIRRQVDLRIEADNLRKFHANFGTNNGGRTEITFPMPIAGWESKNVLVEDLIAGETTTFNNDTVGKSSVVTTTTTVLPISAFLSDSSQKGLDLRRKLARPLLESFLKMLFGDNFIHCDLHPGNVYVKTTTIVSSSDQKERMHHTIVFLDAGIAASLSPQGQQNLRDLFKAVVLNDGEKAGRLMVERARYERCSQVDGGIEAFSKGISNIVAEFHDNRKNGLTLGAVRIGVLLGEVLDLCRVHGVEIDPSMATIVLSTVILEGLGRSLEPDLNLIEFAIPFIMGKYAYKSKKSQE